MRSGFGIVLLLTFLFAGGYFYHIAQAVCPMPLQYSIGQLDSEFGLSTEEAQTAVSNAAEVWEKATGKNLFSYNEDAPFKINFIYDQRQAFTNAEGTFKEKLDATENVSEAISKTYAELVAEYNNLRIQYEDEAEEYERRLQRYNQTVAQYNEEGGAPPEVYEELEQEKKELDATQEQLYVWAKDLNQTVDKINTIGEKGNALVAVYNEGVEKYNKTFGEQREFTQGDYQGTSIHIYTYASGRELETVLAHELGHALSLNHVEGSSSIMYYLIGNQPKDLVLSETDEAEFSRVCESTNLWDKIGVLLNK